MFLDKIETGITKSERNSSIEEFRINSDTKIVIKTEKEFTTGVCHFSFEKYTLNRRNIFNRWKLIDNYSNILLTSTMDVNFDSLVEKCKEDHFRIFLDMNYKSTVRKNKIKKFLK